MKRKDNSFGSFWRTYARRILGNRTNRTNRKDRKVGRSNPPFLPACKLEIAIESLTSSVKEPPRQHWLGL